MRNYANQHAIKLELSPRDAVLQYERRLRERGRPGISASPIFKTTLLSITFTSLKAVVL